MENQYGIAFTSDGGHPDGSSAIVAWKKDDESNLDLVFNSYADALEANDLDGWRGYVRYYPSGEKVIYNVFTGEPR